MPVASEVETITLDALVPIANELAKAADTLAALAVDVSQYGVHIEEIADEAREKCAYVRQVVELLSPQSD
jgi:hypothetical protein